MKKTKFFLLIALLAMVSSASAQFANTNASAGGNKMRSVDTEGWEKVYVSYNPMKMIIDTKGADDVEFTGFSLGYSKGYSISKDFPLFAEVGIEGTYAFKTMDAEDLGYNSNYDIEQKTTYVGVSVPLNLGYKFTIAEKNLSIVPYVGVNLRGNIIGKYKIIQDDEEEDYDYFDKDDVGKDGQWKRVQFGYQLGIGLYYNQVYVGVGHSKDMSELCKKTKVSKTSITLGYTF